MILAAGCVVLGAGAEHQEEVEAQPHGIAPELDVALLEDVKQAHLDFARQIRQLVHGEDAAVGPGEQAIVHRELVAELQTRSGRLDRVDVANHVGDGDVRRRELLHIPGLAREPGDGQLVSLGGQAAAARRTEGRERVVVNLAAGDDRDFRIELIGQRAEEPRLGLTAQTEENEVMFGEQGVGDLRHDALVIADDAPEQGLAGAQARNRIGAQFLFHGASRHATGRGGLAQGPERGRMTHVP